MTCANTYIYPQNIFIFIPLTVEYYSPECEDISNWIQDGPGCNLLVTLLLNPSAYQDYPEI